MNQCIFKIKFCNYQIIIRRCHAVEEELPQENSPSLRKELSDINQELVEKVVVAKDEAQTKGIGISAVKPCVKRDVSEKLTKLFPEF
jgi:uncharacterized membrane protein